MSRLHLHLLAGLAGALAIGAAPSVVVRWWARGHRRTAVDAEPAPIALEVWRRGLVERVVVSGADVAAGDEPTVMGDWLRRHGVPASAVVADPTGVDTWASAATARRLLGGSGRLIVISQGFHLPRALLACRLHGLDAVGVGDLDAARNPRTWWWGEAREIAAIWKLVLRAGAARMGVSRLRA